MRALALAIAVALPTTGAAVLMGRNEAIIAVVVGGLLLAAVSVHDWRRSDLEARWPLVVRWPVTSRTSRLENDGQSTSGGHPTDGNAGSTSRQIDDEDTRRGKEELRVLYVAHGHPAVVAAEDKIGQIGRYLREEGAGTAEEAVGILLQRLGDDAAQARTRADAALVGEAWVGFDEVQRALGDFYRTYQALVTWVEHTSRLTTYPLDAAELTDWQGKDERFLDELRQLTATGRLSRLDNEVRRVGWGEGVRAGLSTLLRDDAAAEPDLQARFSELADEHTIAKVEVANSRDIERARMLADTLELAGWGWQFNPTPQQPSQPNRYLGGTVVRGFNAVLVNAVAEALERAGFAEVVPQVEALQIPPENPKHPSARVSIRIMVGDQQAPS